MLSFNRCDRIKYFFIYLTLFYTQATHMTTTTQDPQDWEITKNEVNYQEILAAQARIQSIVPKTPVTKSIFNSNRFGLDIWFKLENFNVTGSFKIRGAANALRLQNVKDLGKGVIAASAGNHAQGVAYVSKLMGVPATIYMPERTPMVKVEATKGHGAQVVLHGALYDDAFASAIQHQKERGGLLVHAFADTAVINGQGTAGLEILEQIPDLGAVIVPIGGGGLIGGIAAAIKAVRPSTLVIGVQTEAFPSMQVALKEKKIVPVPAGLTIADGIAVKRPYPRTLSLAMHYLDDLIVVSENEIAAAIMSLMEKDHMLAEGAAATTVAALPLIQQKYGSQLQGSKVCCVISGGNIDVTLLSKIATRGLIASGRMMRILVRTKDQPGQLADILKALGQAGANLIELRHNRTFGSMYYSDVDVEIELETVDFAHQQSILAKLDSLGIRHS